MNSPTHQRVPRRARKREHRLRRLVVFGFVRQLSLDGFTIQRIRATRLEDTQRAAATVDRPDRFQGPAEVVDIFEAMSTRFVGSFELGLKVVGVNRVETNLD